jgi:hypothetical protein
MTRESLGRLTWRPDAIYRHAAGDPDMLARRILEDIGQRNTSSPSDPRSNIVGTHLRHHQGHDLWIPVVGW